MIPAIVVFAYLALVLYIGIFAFRRGQSSGEDYFLASRSIGTFVFLLSLVGTNMTAFAILGSSGLAYQRGIGVYGLMAASSGFVIPFMLLLVGTRLWGFGKRFGHMTQVQFFRDRWDCSEIGTVIFALSAAMLVPYIVIGVMGGGTTLEALTATTAPDGTVSSFVSYEVGGAIVALVVMSYVFFGGMRGTAWVNTLQTLMFLSFGTIAFLLIGRELGGLDQVMERLSANPRTASLLTRERMSQAEFWSYFLIPLSSIMFPHMSIMCLTARKVVSFRRTVVLYPLCIALIWLPSVYLGVVAADSFPGLGPGESDDVLLRLLTANTEILVAGVLGAAIMAAVMASDSQILALGTMFTEDVFAHYGATKRFGARAEVWAGRTFVVLITIVAYLVALRAKDQVGIFELSIRFAFSGYAAMTPIMLAALFWKRSTKWGALAATLWVAATVLASWWLHDATLAIAPAPGQPPVPIYPALGGMLLRGTGGVTIWGALPVVPMVAGSALLMWLVSLATRPPSRATVERFFAPAPGVTAGTPQ
ncbi:MAG TPA: sodium:solute symporter family protein [Thermoanaerobaculia bacterium]|nr:sodium:solute symporter family protein [Thermoanaerobaculia bacterium]